MLPPFFQSLPVWVCGTFMCVCVCVCRRERDREGWGYQSPQGVVAGGIHRCLLPLSDNSGVIQARVGRPVLGPWWSTMAFRNSFQPSIHLIPIQHWSTPYTHPCSERERERERVITEPWSILKDLSLSTNYRKAPPNMKNSSKQAAEHFPSTAGEGWV